MPLFSRLKRVAGIFRFWEYFTGEKKELTRYDSKQLKEAYRKYKFIRAIINLSASCLFANFFKIISKDENAQEFLQNFWNQNQGMLLQDGIESALFGNSFLSFFWQDEIKAKILSPGSVKIIFDDKKINPESPETITGYEIKSTIMETEIKQHIFNQYYEFFLRGKSQGRKDNPYGFIPIVQISESCFSDELLGSGEIDDAIYDLAQKYDTLLTKAFNIEDYHGAPLPVYKNVKSFEELKPKLESEEAAKPGFGLYLPNKDADAFFLESKRGSTSNIELLKIIFYNIIIQSETPEFLLGVHMPAAHASTKEQRSAVERKTERRRLVWTQVLQKANEMILKMLEYHTGASFKSYKTDIGWGPIFEKDRVEEADVLDKKSKAVALLKETGTISEETARGALPEIIDSPEKEKSRIEAEKKESTNE